MRELRAIMDLSLCLEDYGEEWMVDANKWVESVVITVSILHSTRMVKPHFTLLIQGCKQVSMALIFVE